MDRVEEKRLITAAQDGDTDAFATLYRAHVQTVYRYIYFRVNDRAIAEDLTGDVFTKVIQGLPTYEDRGRPLIAWLYRIAHARLVDHYRRSSRRDDQELDAQPLPVHTDMDSGMVRRQAAALLRQAITTLTPEQQQVVILRFIEEKKINDVADLMGKKPNAIKALQHRALRSLAAHLERAGIPVDEILSGLSS